MPNWKTSPLLDTDGIAADFGLALIAGPKIERGTRSWCPWPESNGHSLTRNRFESAASTNSALANTNVGADSAAR